MVDLERASLPNVVVTPSPRKRQQEREQPSSTIELNPAQLLLLIVGIGVCVFVATLLYFHEFLHMEHLDMGSLDLNEHPMIKSELGELQRVFKSLSPSFNEFTHFTEGENVHSAVVVDTRTDGGRPRSCSKRT